MTPSILPQKLWRPMAEVKAYVEKMPNGVKSSVLRNKVGAYSSLSTKERNLLLRHLNERESILVFEAMAVGGKNATTFLRHKKYGFPKDIPGYTYPIPKRPILTLQKEPEPQPIPEEVTMTESKQTPESLRKQAEALLKAAEAAELEARDNDNFNKKLAPVKLEVLQAVGAIQRKFDDLMDCVGVLEKAAQKLKELSA
ncbi:Uncharacterised protein [Serratia grimesii]|uniref:hypothetical protein n=1 Tax=Serratia grimesii TaxID=82995 RepID=UPI00217BCC63|nr:hypothetical protein [Serratia grimesii]CAI1835579.1 Uncharacterised protein [Serratia grimesii]